MQDILRKGGLKMSSEEKHIIKSGSQDTNNSVSVNYFSRENERIKRISRDRIRKIVLTGLLIALAIVVRNFSYMVYFGGATGMRITFSGIFTKLAAILSGPLFGGIAGGIVDIVGYLLKPEGAYIPWLTVTAVLGGFITGIIWMVLKNIDTEKFQKVFLALFIVIGLIGIVNHINIAFIPSSPWTHLLNKMGKNMNFTTFGLEAAALIGLVFILIDKLINRFNKNFPVRNDLLKVLFSTGVSGIIVTTLNTQILRMFIPSLGNMGFMVFLVPRLIQEILMVIIQAYIISILLTLYKEKL